MRSILSEKCTWFIGDRGEKTARFPEVVWEEEEERIYKENNSQSF